MADEPKPSRFWVEYLPVNDAYVALFGNKLETASLIPLRHPDIPALGKKRNVATPMEQQYGHERWEQLPKEQTLFSSLEEIDSVLKKSGLWRNPENNDISTIQGPTNLSTPPTPDEPRPTDQSNLPAAIGAAAEASRLALPPDDKPGPKGKAFGSGIGSLMFRRMFPLIQAVQKGYEHLLTEDQKREMREFLAQPTHEFFGMDKSGLESFKEKLGILDDDIPEETSLSVIEGRTEKPLDEVSQSTLKRRLKAAKKELSDLTGMTVKRDVTNRMEERIQNLGKEDPLLARRLDSLVTRIYDLKERINPDTRFGSSWRTHPEQGPPPGPTDLYFQGMARQREETEGTLFKALGSLPSDYLGVESDWFPQDLGRILSNLPPDRIRSIDALLKQRDGKGLLDHTFPQTRTDTIIKVDPDLPRTDPETVQNRVRNILDPGAQSYIQLVDEEPPDTTMAYGGLVVRPLYDP